MLRKIKELFTPEELLKGNYGIERETLRADSIGKLSLTPHPKIFGNKTENPYITTDFSESQIEMITPAFDNIDDTFNFLNALYDIVALEIGDEYLWPQSMPCITPEDGNIPIAEFKEHKEAEEYRKKLLSKYGGKKQLISGIHYNFSFCENLLKTLYEESKEDISFKDYKNNIYLKVTRNYLRYRWLLIYLLGGAATIHKSYVSECPKELNKINCCTYSDDGALSFRNGVCGYKNKVDLYPNYISVDNYVESIREFINDKLIDSHKELYSQIRLKAHNNDDFFNSLLNDGINYLEYRSIDVNPFEKCGISLNDLYFLQLFNIFLLVTEENEYKDWQEDALHNQLQVAQYGQKDISLIFDGKAISKTAWANDILDSILNLNNELNLGKEDIVKSMISKVNDSKLTYAYKISDKVKKEGFVSAHLNLSKEYKKSAYDNRFNLCGYTDMELSTQILMKEAIKRGITTNLIDRNENFISLKNKSRIEYVQQATKTSKDNYATVLMMENKVVTKKVLSSHNIKVPNGCEFNSLEVAYKVIKKYVNIPIVIKPKSTNFGIGISIFPSGANEEDIRNALKIAFSHDNTVLLEEFIKGKEYRFLVINDKVVGILHRVPANVIGDGKCSIKELVNIKNTDPLRGKNYRTPLEKINLDENAKLFLRQENKDINYIPDKGEVVYLRENSNISTGGDSIDYTDLIPERFKKIAIHSANAIGAKICGVDMCIEDYSDSNSVYAIIELNFNPAIHIHSYPYKGTEREIAVEILKLLELI